MRLVELRIKARLTQEELGRLSADENTRPKHHQARISHYELGKKKISLIVAGRIVKALNKQFKKLGLPERAKLEDLLPRKPREARTNPSQETSSAAIT